MSILFILGESVRADHLGINGYHRNTTQNLDELKNVISYKNLYTNKTYTSSSVPQILTDKSIYDTISKNLKNIYDVLDNAGIETFWIGNQLLEVDYKDLANSNNEIIIIDELKSPYSFHKKKDKEMLPFAKDYLDKSSNNSNFITLHMFGSHWWYEDRYEDAQRVFTPVINSKHIPSLSKEQIINSYDNTIVYLDEFLYEAIALLEERKEPTLMIYVSDHGESLGEDGKWLHAHKSKYLTNPAFLIWFSDKFRDQFPDKACFLKDLKDNHLTSDIIYFLILDMFDINITTISSQQPADPVE